MFEPKDGSRSSYCFDDIERVRGRSMSVKGQENQIDRGIDDLKRGGGE